MCPPEPDQPLPSGVDSVLADLKAQGIRQLTPGQTEEMALRAGVSLRQMECAALGRGIVPQRYARNIGTFALEGQRKLLESRVLVVGLGGLGGNVVELLARAGVGVLIGVDPDRFGPENLNRQILCTHADLGRPKVDCAAGRVSQVNPAVEFHCFAARFQDLDEKIFRGLHLALDCIDSIGQRLLLEQKCSQAGVPMVHGAIGGWCGEVGVSWPETRLLSRIYQPDTQGLEDKWGNPPFTPALAASLMVAEGVKVLLGKRPAGPATFLCRFDLAEDEWQRIWFPPP